MLWGFLCDHCGEEVIFHHSITVWCNIIYPCYPQKPCYNTAPSQVQLVSNITLIVHPNPSLKFDNIIIIKIIYLKHFTIINQSLYLRSSHLCGIWSQASVFRYVRHGKNSNRTLAMRIVNWFFNFSNSSFDRRYSLFSK